MSNWRPMSEYPIDPATKEGPVVLFATKTPAVLEGWIYAAGRAWIDAVEKPSGGGLRDAIRFCDQQGRRIWNTPTRWQEIKEPEDA